MPPVLKTKYDFSTLRKRGVKYNKAGMLYFNSCPWAEWWDEFLTSKDEVGKFTYPTQASFAKAKATNEFQKKVILAAIGPKPVGYNARKGMMVPYLGNWQEVRMSTFEHDNRKIQALQEVVKDRLCALDAGRGIADVTLDMIDDWIKLDRKVNTLFEGAIDQLGGKLGAKEYDMLTKYLSMKERTRDGVVLLLHRYLRCHGIGEDQLGLLGQMAMATATATIESVKAGQTMGDPRNNSPFLRLMMESFIKKAETFQMPLPSSIVSEEDVRELVISQEKGGEDDGAV
jgi:hypothetical protein